MFNVLTHSLVPVVSEGNRTAVTLPELFSRLADDVIDSFPGLAAHQTQAWYQFLAQLGAIALHRAGRDRLPGDPERWRVLLSALAPECAWCLVIDEPSEPALLQPPTERIDAFTRSVETPDALDVLVTAKNHDRKADTGRQRPTASVALCPGDPADRPGVLRPRQPRDRTHERWILQPCPRGPATRSALGGRGFDRAIRMLLTRRPDLQARRPDELYRFDGRGLALLWLRSWDTDVPLRLAELDPFFIEGLPAPAVDGGDRGRPHHSGCAASQCTEGGSAGVEGESRRPLGPHQSGQRVRVDG